MPTFREDIKLGTKVPLIKRDDIADFVVGESDVKDGSITASKIANKTITKEKFTDDVQNAIDSIEGKLDKGSVVQTIGTSEDKVMSQKAVTEELKSIHDTTDDIISVMAKNGLNIDLSSSTGWYFRYRTICGANVDGSYKPFTTLSIEARFYFTDVTDKITNITWTRDTDDPEADAAWNKAHANCGLSLPIAYPDLGGNIYQIGHASFTCTAEYDVDGDMYTAQETVSF